jgi:hypothetical protein
MKTEKKRALAKAGDKFTAKAGAKLRKALSSDIVRYLTRDPVAPKSPEGGDNGQWICIDCGALPTQFEMWSHPKSHRIAWRNFISGKIEAPE